MNTIPRPLVRLNQSFIALSAILYLISSNRLLLILPIIFGLSSIFLNYNPLFVLGKRFLKKPMNEYIQEDKAQQRFNQILALSMYILAFVSISLGQVLVSYIFAAMVFLASTIALLGFCIGCFIHYQYHMWKYRRSLVKA
ncbi:MAG: DUF4395 domain-containing protein [Erysipelotrichaceae bacterium]|mgnify:CR=1 FL=1